MGLVPCWTERHAIDQVTKWCRNIINGSLRCCCRARKVHSNRWSCCYFGTYWILSWRVRAVFRYLGIIKLHELIRPSLFSAINVSARSPELLKYKWCLYVYICGSWQSCLQLCTKPVPLIKMLKYYVLNKQNPKEPQSWLAKTERWYLKAETAHREEKFFKHSENEFNTSHYVSDPVIPLQLIQEPSWKSCSGIITFPFYLNKCFFLSHKRYCRTSRTGQGLWGL